MNENTTPRPAPKEQIVTPETVVQTARWQREQLKQRLLQSAHERKEDAVGALNEKVNQLLEQAQQELETAEFTSARSEIDAAHQEALDQLAKEQTGTMGQVDLFLEKYLPDEWSTNTKRLAGAGGLLALGVAGYYFIKKAFKKGVEVTKKAGKTVLDTVKGPFIKIGLAAVAAFGLDAWLNEGRFRKSLGNLTQIQEAFQAGKTGLANVQNTARNTIEKGEQYLETLQAQKHSAEDAGKTKKVHTLQTEIKEVAEQVEQARQKLQEPEAQEQAGKVVQAVKIQALTPLLLRMHAEDADKISFDVYDQANQEYSTAVLQKMHTEQLTIQDVEEILQSDDNRVGQAHQLFLQLFGLKSDLNRNQTEGMKSACALMLTMFTKRKGDMKKNFESHEEGTFEDLLATEALDYLAEGPLDIAQRFAPAIGAMLENPANAKAALHDFLQKSFVESEVLSMRELSVFLEPLSEEERRQVRYETLTKSLVLLNSKLLTEAPSAITEYQDLNTAEKKLLTSIVRVVNNRTPSEDPVLQEVLSRDRVMLEALDEIWKNKLRLKDAIQLHYLLQKAETGTSSASFVLKLKTLQLFSKYNPEMYGRAGGEFTNEVLYNTAGVASGVIDAEELPPEMRSIIKLAAREAQEKGEDWLETVWGLLFSTPGMIVSGVLAVKFREQLSWLASRPLATRNLQRSLKVRRLMYRRDWLLRKKSSIDYICKTYRVPDTVAEQIRQRAEVAHSDMKQKGWLFKETRRSMEMNRAFMEIAEIRYNWLRNETDLEKIARASGLITAHGEADLEGAKEIRRQILQVEAKRKGSPKEKHKLRVITTIDQYLDKRVQQIRRGELDTTKSGAAAKKAKIDQTSTQAKSEPKQKATPSTPPINPVEPKSKPANTQVSAPQEIQAQDTKAEADQETDTSTLDTQLTLVQNNLQSAQEQLKQLKNDNTSNTERVKGARQVQSTLATLETQLNTLATQHAEGSPGRKRINQMREQVESITANAKELEGEGAWSALGQERPAQEAEPKAIQEDTETTSESAIDTEIDRLEQSLESDFHVLTSDVVSLPAAAEARLTRLQEAQQQLEGLEQSANLTTEQQEKVDVLLADTKNAITITKTALPETTATPSANDLLRDLESLTDKSDANTDSQVSLKETVREIQDEANLRAGQAEASTLESAIQQDQDTNIDPDTDIDPNADVNVKIK